MRWEMAEGWLEASVGDSARGLGGSDEKVNKLREAELCDAFERAVCGVEGDEGNDFFKVAEGDVLYVYNGRWYERSDMVCLRSMVKRVMERVGVGLVYQKNSHAKVAQECFDGLLSSERCRFEPDRRYVVFGNGVLDLRSGRMYPHDIRYKTDVVLKMDYRSDAESPLWDGLVAQTIPDEGMRRAFQQFCGGFLADRGEFKIEYMCLMVGSGRNGKSVLCEAVTGMFGNDLVSSYSPEDLFKSGQSEYRLADINGKLANYADDVSNRDFSGGDFKRFISGAKFQGRHIYGRPFVVTKVPLMLCCVNEIPPTSDDSNGHFRRLLPIICPNQVADCDVDVQLPQKLAAPEVREAIFNWVLAGYRDLVAAGGKIEISPSIRELRETIKEDSNSARRWLREMGYSPSPGPGVWMSMKSLMSEYIAYCKDYSENPRTAKSVGKMLSEMGFRRERRRDTSYYLVGTGEPAPEQAGPKEDLPF
jgi:P4 family phage/plasmid primase-like protien